MTQSLIDKIRAARQSTVEADGRRWTIARPTDAEAATLGRSTPLELVTRFVVGWSLEEIDIIPGGSPMPVEFDRALWGEWVADQPQLWAPLSEAIINAYLSHQRAREEAAKN